MKYSPIDRLVLGTALATTMALWAYPAAAQLRVQVAALAPGTNEFNVGTSTVGDQQIAGKRFSTDAQTYMELVFPDGTSVVLAPATSIEVDRFAYDPATGKRDFALRLQGGVVRVVASGGDPILVHTPGGIVELRNGSAMVEVDPQGTSMATLLWGRDLIVRNAAGQQAVRRAGYAVSFNADNKPSDPRQMSQSELSQRSARLLPPRGTQVAIVEQTPDSLAEVAPAAGGGAAGGTGGGGDAQTSDQGGPGNASDRNADTALSQIAQNRNLNAFSSGSQIQPQQVAALQRAALNFGGALGTQATDGEFLARVTPSNTATDTAIFFPAEDGSFSPFPLRLKRSPAGSATNVVQFGSGAPQIRDTAYRDLRSDGGFVFTVDNQTNGKPIYDATVNQSFYDIQGSGRFRFSEPQAVYLGIGGGTSPADSTNSGLFAIAAGGLGGFDNGFTGADVRLIADPFGSYLSLNRSSVAQTGAVVFGTGFNPVTDDLEFSGAVYRQFSPNFTGKFVVSADLAGNPNFAAYDIVITNTPRIGNGTFSFNYDDNGDSKTMTVDACASVPCDSVDRPPRGVGDRYFIFGGTQAPGYVLVPDPDNAPGLVNSFGVFSVRQYAVSDGLLDFDTGDLSGSARNLFGRQGTSGRALNTGFRLESSYIGNAPVGDTGLLVASSNEGIVFMRGDLQIGADGRANASIATGVVAAPSGNALNTMRLDGAVVGSYRPSVGEASVHIASSLGSVGTANGDRDAHIFRDGGSIVLSQNPSSGAPTPGVEDKGLTGGRTEFAYTRLATEVAQGSDALPELAQFPSPRASSTLAGYAVGLAESTTTGDVTTIYALTSTPAAGGAGPDQIAITTNANANTLTAQFTLSAQSIDGAPPPSSGATIGFGGTTGTSAYLTDNTFAARTPTGPDMAMVSSPVLAKGIAGPDGAALATTDYQHVRWGVWLGDLINSPSQRDRVNLGYFVAGKPTDPATMSNVSVATATYSGQMLGTVYDQASGQVRDRAGNFTNAWNFGTRSGAVTANFDSAQYKGAVTAPVSPTTFGGNLQNTAVGGIAANTRTMTMNGSMFGPVVNGAAPPEMAGKFSIKENAPGANLYRAQGVFIGKVTGP